MSDKQDKNKITISDIFWFLVKIVVAVYIIFAVPFIIDTIEELWNMYQYTRMGG